jgi:hypothetical protein
MTEVLFAGGSSDRHEVRLPTFSAAGDPRSPDIDKMRPKPVEPERPFAHMMVGVGRRRPKPLSAETHAQ